MIYKILTQDLTDAMSRGVRMLAMSADGMYTLVQTEIALTAIESCQDNELETLMNLPEYRQPCKDCKI